MEHTDSCEMVLLIVPLTLVCLPELSGHRIERSAKASAGTEKTWLLPPQPRLLSWAKPAHGVRGQT